MTAMKGEEKDEEKHGQCFIHTNNYPNSRSTPAHQGLTKYVSGRMMLPRAVHVLIPGTCEYVAFCDCISLLGLP